MKSPVNLMYPVYPKVNQVNPYENMMKHPRKTIDTPVGVSFNTRDNVYQARIAHNGINVSLGYFDTAEAAKIAHDAAMKLSLKIKRLEKLRRKPVNQGGHRNG